MEQTTVETTDYTLHGKLITHLTKRTVVNGGAPTTEEMHFFYDAQSRSAMVEFGGAMYTYRHNLQGDIIGIVDNTGRLVVRYGYDAWGKPTEVWSEDSEMLAASLITAYATLAALNPFRYRGYVWDDETGLYYLRSRYYNPGWGRFLNEDILLGVKNHIFTHNQFSYCANSPIVRSDPTGCLYYGPSPERLEEYWRKKLSVRVTIGSVEKEANSTKLVIYVERRINDYSTEYNTFVVEFATEAQRDSYYAEKSRRAVGADVGFVLSNGGSAALGTAIGAALGTGAIASTVGGFIGGVAVGGLFLLAEGAENELYNTLVDLQEELENANSDCGIALVDRSYYIHTEGLGSTSVFGERYYCVWDESTGYLGILG